MLKNNLIAYAFYHLRNSALQRIKKLKFLINDNINIDKKCNSMIAFYFDY